MTSTQAIKKAEETGKPVKFEHWAGSKLDGFQGSEVGRALPCGCLELTTILSDGSLGWGEWTEPCCIDHIQ